MEDAISPRTETIETPGYIGLRMSADEFLALPESSDRYELVDGVVLMSPSPQLPHQRIARELLFQLAAYLEENPCGEVLADIDVKIGDRLVYRPDLVYLSAAKIARMSRHITEPPDLVIEIVSPSSRTFDATTKLHDYQAAGVSEYWLIDPERQSMRFFMLEGGVYREIEGDQRTHISRAVTGFELNLKRVARYFESRLGG